MDTTRTHFRTIIHTDRSSLDHGGHGREPCSMLVCHRMSDTSHLEVFVLAVVCWETEKKIMWMHNTFISVKHKPCFLMSIKEFQEILITFGYKLKEVTLFWAWISAEGRLGLYLRWIYFYWPSSHSKLILQTIALNYTRRYFILYWVAFFKQIVHPQASGNCLRSYVSPMVK